MNKKNLFSIYFLTLAFSFSLHAEVIVKDALFNSDSFSFVSSDLVNYYAGVAGTTCPGDGLKTCNSCIDTTTGSPQSCNPKQIYGSLKVKVSFTLTRVVTAPAIANLQIENDVANTYALIGSPITIPTTAAVGSTFSLEASWSELCFVLGATSSCTPAAVIAKSRRLGVGVDSNASGTVDPEELKFVTLKVHFLPSTATEKTQPYCPDKQHITTTNRGICNVTYTPGDEKVYIDSTVYAGADATSALDWDAVAIFPIKVLNDGSGDAAAFSTFTNGKAQPIISKITITAAGTDVSIDNSAVGGSLINYQRYCFVYGTKNLAQNIYRFVLGAVNGCATPSEVVGLLNDQHCFISTAAFGSDMAPEVSLFRKFRNEFLLNNSLGKQFVKYYYLYSPPLANFIAQSDYLKAMARMFLYPLLVFSYLSLNYGILVALLSLAVALILLSQVCKFLFRNKKVLLVLILLISLNLKAVDEPETKRVAHPGAAQGLVRIRKDGSYVYDVPFEIKNQSNHLSIGQSNHPDVSVTIETTDSLGNVNGKKVLDFDDFYEGASNLLISYDFEKYPWIGNGMLGYQLGFSFMYADGHGRLKAVSAGATPAVSVEKFSFLTLPLNFGLVYRLQYKNLQKLVPYIAGGGTYVILAEKREDQSRIYYTNGLGFYAAGGLLLNLSAFSSEQAFQLNSEYGIGNLWFTLEFRLIEVSTEAFSLKNKSVNAGISFDY